MFDFVGFCHDYGVLYGISLVVFGVLCMILWRDLKVWGRKLKRTMKRVEVLEESCKHDQDGSKIICRADCINHLKSIENKLDKLI